MSSWSGRRKALIVLLFVGPTILGILVFNVYPIIYNTYISFTNRNQFHPNPDCSVGLTGIIEPNCWPVFKNRAGKGVGQPFVLQKPIFGNYGDLLGKLFTGQGLLSLLIVIVSLAPFYAANRLNKYYDRQIERPIGSIWIWLGAAALAVALGLLINFRSAIDALQQSGDFFVVVFRTILFVILTIPINYVFGLALALVLNSDHIKMRTFFRAVMIIPWAASTMFIIMSLIWQFFFRSQGTVNQLLLQLFRIQGPAWLNNPTFAFAIILLVNLWFSFPFAFNIILGALQSVPADQYEAAEMDGATYWQQLTSITLPLIRPAVLPAIVLSAIGAGGFQMFGTVWAITQGGPSRGAGAPGATELVMVYAYKQVFQSNAYAKAGAFAVIIFIFLFVATLYSLRMTRLTKGAYE